MKKSILTIACIAAALSFTACGGGAGTENGEMHDHEHAHEDGEMHGHDHDSTHHDMANEEAGHIHEDGEDHDHDH